MQFEVEQKFAVDDLESMVQQLASLGAEERPETLEADTYFAHPARDFAVTDEALRLRQVAQQNWVTYKGPKLDPLTKTRREIEIALRDGAELERQFHELLEVLGFRSVATVRKRRRHRLLSWQGRQIHITLDQVDDVGTYVELECLASDSELDAARGSIASLAARLSLENNERRSYLELLLNGRNQSR